MSYGIKVIVQSDGYQIEGWLAVAAAAVAAASAADDVATQYAGPLWFLSAAQMKCTYPHKRHCTSNFSECPLGPNGLAKMVAGNLQSCHTCQNLYGSKYIEYLILVRNTGHVGHIVGLFVGQA